MDSVLHERLSHLSTQNDRLKQAEGEYRLKEAQKKSLEADLYLKSEGKNVAEREAKSYSSEEWKSFSRELSELQTKYNFESRRFEILMNAYYGELNTFKRDETLIKKGAQ